MKFLFGSKLLTFAISILSTLYVIKLLPASDFGFYTAILMGIPFISQLASMANYEYLLKELIKSKNEKEDGVILFSCLFLPVLLSIILVILINSIYTNIPYVVSIYVVALCCFEYIQRYYISKSESKFIACNDFFLNAGWILYFFLIKFFFEIENILDTIFICRTLSIFTSLLIFMRFKKTLIKKFRFSLKIVKDSYIYGYTIVIGALSYSLLRGAERLLLARLSDLEQTGIYSFIQAPLNILFALFTGTIFITSIKYIRLESEEKGTNLVLINVRNIVTILFLPLLMTMSLNFDLAIELIGHSKYQIDYIYPVISAFSVFLFMIISIYRQDLNLTGNGHKITKYFFFAIIINVILSFFTYSYYGYKSAVVVNFLSNTFLLYCFWLNKSIENRFLLVIIIYSLICYVLHFLIYNTFQVIYFNLFYRIIFIFFEYIVFLLTMHFLKFFDLKDLLLLNQRFGYD